jgi:hypothetical protein
MKIIITEDQRDSMREDLRDLTNDVGLVTALKAVGGVNNYIKILYDGDITQYFRETGFPPIRISSEPNLYIDDLIVQKLNLPSIRFIGKDMKDLGEFTWNSGGTYKFHAQLIPMVALHSGQKTWRVVGQSGDYGFGYYFITKRNTLGKRARRQIFQQIIDKYNLNSYM